MIHPFPKRKNLYCYLSICLWLGCSSFCIAQNLVINGDFEIGDKDCDKSKFIIAPILEGWEHTSLFPIYQRENCALIDQTNLTVFPNNGNGHLSILGNRWITGFLDASIVKGQLAQPLKADGRYYLEFYGKSTGFRDDDEFSSTICAPTPSQTISVALGQPDAILETQKGFSGANNFLTALTLQNTFDPVPFPNPIQIQSTTEPWTKYSTCFTANGGETQIALHSSIGPYTATNTCPVISEIDSIKFEDRLYQIFAYEVDDIVLHYIPDQLAGQKSYCQADGTIINLLDYFPPDTLLQKNATFTWPDGSKQAVRSNMNSGFYEIAVNVFCSTFPLTLEIIAENCADLAYIPTAFSPNNDGINDEFMPLFDSNDRIENYFFAVYDKWGNKVFDTNAIEIGWNGEFQQKLFNNTSFLWQVSYTVAESDITYQKSGSVSLIR